MTITEHQKQFTKAIHQKFPKRWTTEQRLLSLYRQVADISYTLHFKKIKKVNLQTRIADTFIDLFVLCEELNVDLEKEFKRIMKWTKK
jgi:NTP pyrophosphatase (non-canonical NTP hydrolase)